MLIILELGNFGSKSHQGWQIAVLIPTNLYLCVSQQSPSIYIFYTTHSLCCSWKLVKFEEMVIKNLPGSFRMPKITKKNFRSYTCYFVMYSFNVKKCFINIYLLKSFIVRITGHVLLKETSNKIVLCLFGSLKEYVTLEISLLIGGRNQVLKIMAAATYTS